MENQTLGVAAPTVAPMTVAPMIFAPIMVAPMTADPMAAPSRRMVAGFSDRLMVAPAAGVTAHVTGQVSFANANVVFIKSWAPPPRRVPL